LSKAYDNLKHGRGEEKIRRSSSKEEVETLDLFAYIAAKRDMAAAKQPAASAEPARAGTVAAPAPPPQPVPSPLQEEKQPPAPPQKPVEKPAPARPEHAASIYVPGGRRGVLAREDEELAQPPQKKRPVIPVLAVLCLLASAAALIVAVGGPGGGEDAQPALEPAASTQEEEPAGADSAASAPVAPNPPRTTPAAEPAVVPPPEPAPAAEPMAEPRHRLEAPGAAVAADASGFTVTFRKGLFSSGRHLSDEARANLRALGRELSGFGPGVRVTVVGCTDNVPVKRQQSYKDNQALGLIRAAEVSRVLQASSGLPASVFKTVSYGTKWAPYPNNTAENRARNRTAVIRIAPPAS
jgi:flagellar motor protein MotB